MWLAGQWTDYELLDCGRGEKLERWGSGRTSSLTPGTPAPAPGGASGRTKASPSGGRSTIKT